MKKVAVYGSFDDLPKPYEEFFSEAGSVSGFFLSLPWFRHLATQVYQNKSYFRIYGVESGSRPGYPYLALPMCHSISGHKFFDARKLMPIANYYTPLFSPAARSGHSLQEDLNRIAKVIAAERPRWDVIDLHPMQVNTPIFDGMLRAFQDVGLIAKTYFCFGNWYLDVNNRSYAEYFDSLPSKLRSTLKRKSRKLHDSHRLRIEIVSSERELQEGLSAYERIYQASWKEPESHPEFVAGLIRLCARHGCLRLGIAYVDDQPAAAQLWMVSNGVASIYKLAYDERFSTLSVGSILTSRLMEHVIDVDGVREVDYLSGDDSYKQDWMSHRRERHGIIVFNPHTVHGMLGAIQHAGGDALRKFKRSPLRTNSPAETDRAAPRNEQASSQSLH